MTKRPELTMPELLLLLVRKVEALEGCVRDLAQLSANHYATVAEVAAHCGMTPGGVHWHLNHNPNLVPDVDYRKSGGKYLILRSSIVKFQTGEKVK